jgi:hypothetical protein
MRDFIGPRFPIGSVGEILPTKTNTTIDVQAALLQLVSSRETVEVTKTPVMIEPTRPGEIWISAKRVVLHSDAYLKIGTRNLVIAAYELVIEPGARVEAFPRNARLGHSAGSIADGAAAGDVSIVVLGSVTGSGSLMVDLAGEDGRQGQQGAPGGGLTPRVTTIPPDNGASEVLTDKSSNLPPNGTINVFEHSVIDLKLHSTIYL